MLDAVIIGGGLAGLACARELHAKDISFLLVESSDAVGGRVRTDASEGFLLDRGFQVMLTAYPEAQRQLDYSKLELCNFEPGAMVHYGRGFHRVSDPFRRPSRIVQTAFSGTLGLRDKFEIARLRLALHGLPPEQMFRGEQEDTMSFLRRTGFSQRGIDRFFAPFFGGVFLDTSLRSSSRYFKFLFQCFADGNTAVPRLGMEQLPQQIAAVLPSMRIMLHTQATRIERAGSKGYAVHTVTGEQMRQTVEARTVIVATDADAAQQLVAQAGPQARRATTVVWNGTTTFYYAARHAPVEEAIVLLNGEGTAGGPVNHAAVMTNASAAYAPAGAHLICANVVGTAPQSEQERKQLEADARTQMRRWFGQQVGQWQVVGGYFVPHAVPLQRYAEWEQGPTSVKAAASARSKKEDTQEIFICGDYCETASIQGALVSGRRTAAAVAATLRQG